MGWRRAKKGIVKKNGGNSKYETRSYQGKCVPGRKGGYAIDGADGREIQKREKATQLWQKLRMLANSDAKVGQGPPAGTRVIYKEGTRGSRETAECIIPHSRPQPRGERIGKGLPKEKDRYSWESRYRNEFKI